MLFRGRGSQGHESHNKFLDMRLDMMIDIFEGRSQDRETNKKNHFNKCAVGNEICLRGGIPRHETQQKIHETLNTK